MGDTEDVRLPLRVVLPVPVVQVVVTDRETERDMERDAL